MTKKKQAAEGSRPPAANEVLSTDSSIAETPSKSNRRAGLKREALSFLAEARRQFLLAIAVRRWEGQPKFKDKLKENLEELSAKAGELERSLAAPAHGGGPKPTPKEIKERIVAEWQEAMGKVNQECFCSDRAISVSSLERWIREVAEP
jgi:hypothetical protein